MLDRAFFGLFAFALLIIVNDIMGWGILSSSQYVSLNDISDFVLSPAYQVIEMKTGIDSRPLVMFKKISELMATR